MQRDNSTVASTPRVVAVGVAGGLLATVLTACQSSPDSAKDEEDWCATRSEPVTCISDARSLQAVIYEGDADSSSAVLWDPGGPGLGLPDKDADLGEIIPRAVRGRNVVLLVEPWVRNPPSPQCLKSSPTEGEKTSMACDLRSQATETQQITRAINLVQSAQRLEVTGAYLQSFGATRTLPTLDEAGSVQWVVLESPGPPPGTPAPRIMESRKQAILDLLARICDDECERTPSELLQTLTADEAIDAAEHREMVLGLIALATQPTANAEALKQLVDDLSEDGRVGEDLRKQMLQLGRLYQGRAPGGRIAPSMVGLWADTCPRFTAWDQLNTTDDTLVSAYADVFQPCVHDTTQTKADRTPQMQTLMLTGEHDTVTPPDLQALWEIRDLDTLRGEEHFWDDSTVTRQIEDWIQTHDAQ